MKSIEVLASLSRRIRRPGVIWAVMLISMGFMYSQRLPGNLSVGHLGHMALIPILTSGAFAWLSPIPWQWSGKSTAPPSFIRGLYQAILVMESALFSLVALDAYFYNLMRVPFDWELTLEQNGVMWAPLMVVIGNLIATREQGEFEKKQAEAQAREAQFRALQGQLHPHVLFNALNGLAELIHKGSEEAETCVRHLSDLLRKVLWATDDMSYTLRKEQDLLEDYLHMEGLRLGKRLRLNWDFDPALDALKLPPLLLQPLVENALKHGVAPCTEGGELRIQSRGEGSQAVLSVWNTGMPLAADRVSETAVGLLNLVARLQLAFGGHARFSLRSEGGWTLAEIRLPWIASQDPEETYECVESGRGGGRVPGAGTLVAPADGAGLPGGGPA